MGPAPSFPIHSSHVNCQPCWLSPLVVASLRPSRSGSWSPPRRQDETSKCFEVSDLVTASCAGHSTLGWQFWEAGGLYTVRFQIHLISLHTWTDRTHALLCYTAHTGNSLWFEQQGPEAKPSCLPSPVGSLIFRLTISELSSSPPHLFHV